MLEILGYLLLIGIAVLVLKFAFSLIIRWCALGIVAFLSVGAITGALSIFGVISSDAAWTISKWAFCIGLVINIIDVFFRLSYVKKFYVKFTHFLSKHKGIPLFFAHGGLHVVVLLILAVIAIYMVIYLSRSNVTSFNQIIYSFYGDTLKNYRLNYLSFEKDMSRRPDNTYNVNDIQLHYGYIRDTTKNKEKRTILLKTGNKADSCDLISLVRFVTRNNLSDTILYPRTICFYHYIPLNQIYWDIKRSNHDRYYFSSSNLKDTLHVFHRFTHAKDHVIEWGSINPNFNFWIGIVMDDKTKLNEKSSIKIKFNNIRGGNSKEGVDHPLLIESVLPKPTRGDINEIEYKGKELEAVIKQHGIYVSGVDSLKKEKAERTNLYTTVYLGTIIAFMLDIFIHLILKWRQLKDKNKEHPVS